MANVGEPGHAVLVPPVRPGPGMIVREEAPRRRRCRCSPPEPCPRPAPTGTGPTRTRGSPRTGHPPPHPWPRPAGHVQRSHPEVPRAASSCRRSWGPPRKRCRPNLSRHARIAAHDLVHRTLYDVMHRAGCALWHDDSRRRIALVAPEQQFTFRSRRRRLVRLDEDRRLRSGRRPQSAAAPMQSASNGYLCGTPCQLIPPEALRLSPPITFGQPTLLPPVEAVIACRAREGVGRQNDSRREHPVPFPGTSPALTNRPLRAAGYPSSGNAGPAHSRPVRQAHPIMDVR